MTAPAVIAYWGPGLSGKSTNLAVVKGVLAGHACDHTEREELSAGALECVLFDLGPGGSAMELCAPPGQRHHRLMRQGLFKGVDGVVFVADSSASAVGVNLAALEELELCVASRRQELRELPLVFQFNKRDLPDALEVSRLQELLNPSGRPSVEAIATRGVGVFPALKAIASELQRFGVRTKGETCEDLSAAHPASLISQLSGVRERLEREGEAGAAGSGASLSSEAELAEPAGAARLGLRNMALACILGALLREVFELGWRLAVGAG